MILDIKTFAASVTDDIKNKVDELSEKPQLAIVMVGNNSASEIYVKNKIKKCEEVGIRATLHHQSETLTQEVLINLIKKLNSDPSVTGILVQSPLPSHIDAQKVFDVIDPQKDVDGFSSANISKLYSGDISGLVPGTPKGIMKIIENYFGGDNVEGKSAVVIGKSTIVGKPVAMLLLQAGVTVTICHSRTKNLSTHTKNTDIVIAAVGKKHLITAEMVSPKTLVIDVGINVEGDGEGRKLSGDCDTEQISRIADITPVPGGVGPMTIAMLLSNTLLAHQLQGKK